MNFKHGVEPIPPSGKVVGEWEKNNLMAAVKDEHFTEGRFVEMFEKALAKYIGVRRALMVNSGSSANLLALAAIIELNSIPKGSKVITTACGFPTTVNPIIQLGMKPVFIDVDLGTYVPSLEAIEEAIDVDTCAIMMAHTLGNPWPAHDMMNHPYRLAIVEDNCDALGSELAGIRTGGIGHVGTSSFYPAHHITSGEGGAVYSRDPLLMKIVRSLRDWGRDCWCKPGESNTCKRRFLRDYDQLPSGYDHKYVYSRIGWNMKSTDFAGAIAMAQMHKIDEFTAQRKKNFEMIDGMLRRVGMEGVFVLPKAADCANPNWFGYPLTVRDGMGFNAQDFTRFIEREYLVGTRRLFAGNILKHPAYEFIDCEIVGDLHNSDTVLDKTFWVGLWHGMDEEDAAYVAASVIKTAKELSCAPGMCE